MNKFLNNSLIISNGFKTQLITSILSAPIVYIPHFHYNYVDAALSEIFPQEDLSELGTSNRNILGLTRDTIYEYDLNRGRLDFESKRPIKAETSIQIMSVIKNLLIRNEQESDSPIVLENCKVILFKNVGQSLLKDPSFQLLLQTFAEKYERGDYDVRTTIIIVSPIPVSMIPLEIMDVLSVIHILPPSFTEIEGYVKKIPVSKHSILKKESLRSDLCRTLQGLQLYDINQILASVCARTGGVLTEFSEALALEEKKRIVKKSGIIEVVDSDVSFKDIGGIDVLREDLEQKAIIYKNLSLATSKNINVSIPKGILIVGMPGCGKSMIAKSIAKEFGVSLLRLDISNLMGQYVGQSEENLRKALTTAEAAHPCVLWIDEIEKAFHGANNSNGNENDTLVMRMMGYFLTWMQERKTAVFIVATANDVMRPEFMRKGRFDEVYFVDFPNEKEREIIFKKKIEHFQDSSEQPSIFDFSKITSFDKIIKATNAKNTNSKGGFSGAEIDQIINGVIENNFIEYLKELKKNGTAKKRIIEEQEILAVIKKMENSVMCNQINDDRENNSKSGQQLFGNLTSSLEERELQHPSLSSVEKIYKMQELYHFKPASRI